MGNSQGKRKLKATQAAIKNMITYTELGNIEGGRVGPYYTKNAVLMRVGVEPLKGREAIENYMVSLRASRKVKKAEFVPEEIQLICEGKALVTTLNTLTWEDGTRSQSRSLQLLTYLKKERVWTIYRESVIPVDMNAKKQVLRSNSRHSTSRYSTSRHSYSSVKKNSVRSISRDSYFDVD